MSEDSIRFPPLIDAASEPWPWPEPPFAWRHITAHDAGAPQPCRIESLSGSEVDGLMIGFDAPGGAVSLRTSESGPVVSLSFARFRRLSLTTPLRPAPRTAGAPAERVPAAAQEREYRVRLNDRTEILTGRTAGHVETAEGLYLFTPVEDEAALQRVFVPREAYAQCEFGPSAEEAAASRWCASPRELLDAIEKQKTMPVKRLGHSLLEVGLLTQAQLDRALASQPKDRPLGESLVAAGIISRADLQTAIAHKMGYPLVDLTRFPIDPAAVAKLPGRNAVECRALPIMLEGDRLIVAVDKPSRVVKLSTLQAVARLRVVPVLTPKLQLMTALDRLSKDVWAAYGSQRSRFFPTTV
jgi:hypothetical protein